MKLYFKKIKTSGIAIWLFILVVLFITLYFFIRLSKNDQVLEQRGFRTLTQLGKAIKEKDTVIWGVVKNGKITEEGNPSLPLGDSPIKKQLYPSTAIGSIDSLMYFISSRRDFSPRRSSKPDQSPRISNTVKVDGVHKSEISSTVEFSGTNEGLSKKDSTAQGKGGLFKMSIKDFITPLLTRRDFFSHYVLLRNDTIVFNTFGGDAILLKDVFKKGELKKSLLSNSANTNQSSGDSSLFIQAGFSQKVKILGKNYLLFAVPLKFNSKPDWYLGGLVEERVFLSWKRNLPSEIIVAFCVLLLAIVFSFPILKVFLSGPLEKLSRIGISLTGISLIISPIFIVILMSEFLLSSTSKKDTLESLNILNGNIKRAFVNESDSILMQLKSYQNADFEKYKDSVIILSETDVDSFKPFKYRLFKSFFPADADGNQWFYLTPYKTGDISNVATRDYCINPERYTRIIGSDTIWYNMEPIYSNTSGEWVLAFSMPARKPETAKIIALTSAMYSLKYPILPKDYRFCLIEKSGKIWFDSKEIFNLSDNFIEETDNCQQLIQALKSANASSFKASLRNKKNLMVVAPVDNTQLFMVTMFDPAVNNSMEALSATFVIAFFSVIYFALFILIVLMKMIRHKSSKLNGRVYFFSWLTPKKSKTNVYKLLLIFNAIIIFVLIGLSFSGAFTRLDLNTFVWIFLVFVSTHFPILYLIRSFLRKNDVVIHKVKNYLPKYLKIWFLKRNSGEEQKLRIFTGNYLTLFTMFLFSSLLVSSILPAMFMMSRFSTEENKLNISTQQHDLAYKINTRTMVLKDFSDANYPEDQIITYLNKRNQQGHYYDSVCVSDGDCLKEFGEKIGGSYISSPFIKLRRADYQEMMGQETPIITDKVSNSKSFYSNKADQIKLTYDKILFAENGNKTTKKDSFYSKKIGLQLYKPIDSSGKWKWNVAVFWAALFVVLLLLYFLIKNIVKLLFPYQELGFKGVDIHKLKENLKKGNKNIVLVSLSKDGKKLTSEQQFCRIDLADSPSKDSVTNDQVKLIVNFEKGIKNPIDLEKRLRLLEAFLKQKPVILLLSKTPAQMVNFYTN